MWGQTACLAYKPLNEEKSHPNWKRITMDFEPKHWLNGFWDILKKKCYYFVYGCEVNISHQLGEMWQVMSFFNKYSLSLPSPPREEYPSH